MRLINRLRCRIFGHDLVKSGNMWVCKRCDWARFASGGIVPTDRVTPAAPPPPPIDSDCNTPPCSADAIYHAIEKVKAAGHPVPDCIFVGRTSSGKFVKGHKPTAKRGSNGRFCKTKEDDSSKS